jgi:predicted RNA-binding Zn ribbon-like protein
MPDPEFLLLGDAVWLDFVNTARGRGPRVDRLPDAAAYHRWTKACKLRSDADARDFALVRRLRNRLVTLAEALSDDGPAPTACISMLNALLRTTGGRQQLTRQSGSWSVRFAPDGPPTALVAVAHSAAASLSNPLCRIRRCAGTGCTLFFSDTSVAKGRRWCVHEVCGSGAWVERRRGALR